MFQAEETANTQGKAKAKPQRQQKAWQRIKHDWITAGMGQTGEGSGVGG